MTKRLLCLLITLSFLAPLSAQKKADHFTVIDEKDGLVKAVVSGVQDDQGFLWFGSEGNNGVYRYDGNEFRQFKHNPLVENSIVPGNIYSIITDRDGQIWFASDGGGLSRYSPVKEEFANYAHDPDNPNSLADNTVYALLEDRKGNIWAATAKSLDRLELGTGNITHFHPEMDAPGKLSSAIIFHLAESGDGTIWIGTLGGGLNSFDPETGEFTLYRHDPEDPESLAHDTCGAIVEDRQGRIWVGGMGGLNLLDRSTGKFTRFVHDPDDPATIADNYVWDIQVDGDDNLWLGGYGGGLAYFDTANGRAQRFLPDAADPGSLSSKLVFFLMIDRGGILWIGTGDGGLNKHIPLNSQFEHYQHIPGDPNSFTATSLFTVYQTSDEYIWIGGQGHQAGLSRWDRNEGIITHYLPEENDPDSISSGEVAALLESRDGLFYIGQQGVFSLFVREGEKFIPLFPTEEYKHRFNGKVIYHITEDHRGTLWLATEIGLISYSPVRESYELFFEDTPIKTLLADKDGFLWVGTSSEGVIQFDLGTGNWKKFKNNPENRESLQTGEITSLFQDSRGRLWIGTSGGGLNLWQGDFFKYFNGESGFTDNIIFSILEDRNGNFWMGTSRGLVQYHPERESLINYTEADGIQGNEFSIRQDNAFEGIDGLFYFIGKGGLTLFDPYHIKRNESVPSLSLTGFRIYNEEAALGTAPFAAEQLELSWKDSMITFDFAALDYQNPRSNQYAYMMEGFDSDWIPAGNRGSATYTNLDGGDYTFRVKGSNNHGVWNEAGIALDISITPQWWKTKLFYLILTIVIIGVIILVAYYVWKLNEEIRAHERSDRELHKFQNYLSDTIDSMPSILVGVDENMKVILWNSTSVEITGISAESAIGNDLFRVFPILREIKDPINNSILNKEHKELKKTPMEVDGTTLYQDFTIYPLSGAKGGAVIRVDDVTSQVKVDEMIIQSEKMLTVGGLAAGMAHEINNPVAGILLATNLIKSEQVEPEDYLQMIDMIDESGERIARIVENMLSFSRKSGDKGELHDVTELLDKVLELAATDSELKKDDYFGRIEIVREYSTDLNPVTCKSSKIQQVLLNIIINGAQAMQSAHIENPRFVLRAGVDAKGDKVFLEIGDNGPGMEEEVRKRIFEPFFTTKPVGVGTGLGMSVSYFIITKDHKGELSVESEPGKGAKFIIRLPAGKR